MSLKYSPTDDEVKAEREYVIDVPSALLLPLALELLHRLHNSECAISDDYIEPIFVKGVLDKEKPNGFAGALLVLDVLDGDKSEDDEEEDT